MEVAPRYKLHVLSVYNFYTAKLFTLFELFTSLPPLPLFFCYTAYTAYTMAYVPTCIAVWSERHYDNMFILLLGFGAKKGNG